MNRRAKSSSTARRELSAKKSSVPLPPVGRTVFSPASLLRRKRVLGIDPGYDRLGLAVIEGDPSRPTYIWSDCVTPEKGAAHERLAAVYGAVADAIREHSPSALAIESLFFSVNKKSALQVAEARGAILAAAGAANLSVIEFSPGQVKMAVTGYGAADKKAVERMVPKLIALPPKKRLDDELDAIAVAIAALPQLRG